jgi:hypothetical protein
METSTSQAFRLVIRNKEGLLYLISLINGTFRTPKINKLYSLIDYINSNIITYKLKDYQTKVNIHYLDLVINFTLDFSPIGSNKW